jgi:hypothetical protein
MELAELLDKADSVDECPRPDWQKSLEANITLFHPDAIEAMELLDAITGSIRNRYAHMKRISEGFRDVEHYAKRLRVALEALETGMIESYKHDEVDQFDAHRDQLAREAGW